METAIRLPEQVQWSEGLLLSPQHLQQSDMYWQSQLCYQLSAINPDFWGVRTLELDDAKLADGIIKVTKLECVLPDGSVIQYPANYPNLQLSLDLTSVMTKGSGALRISLALPVRGTAVIAASGIVKRYESVDGGLVSDENTGNGEMPIARLRPLIALQAGPITSNYCACPLFAVERESTGHYRLTSYHPPMLDLGASTFYGANAGPNDFSLRPRVQKLRVALWAKLRELSGTPVDGAVDSAQVAATTTGNHFQLMVARQLATILPVFDLMVLAGDTRPRDMYRMLAVLAGQVSVIDAIPSPPVLTPYRHDDCYAQLDAVLRYIDDKIAPITSNFELIAFVQDDAGSFSQMMPLDVERELIVEVKPRPGQSPEEIGRWLEQSMISSAHLAHELGQRRLLGALTSLLEVDEIRRLGLRAGGLFYRIENQTIEYNGEVTAVFHPNKSLMVKGPANLHIPAGIILYRKRAGGLAPAVAPARHAMNSPAPVVSNHSSDKPREEPHGSD